MTRIGLTPAGQDLLGRSPSWNALPERDADGRWLITGEVDPMWPEYGGSLRLLTALSADGHEVEDLEDAMTEQGRVVAPRLAQVHTGDAAAALASVVFAAGFHVAATAVEGRTDTVVDDGWHGDQEPRRFRTVLSAEAFEAPAPASAAAAPAAPVPVHAAAPAPVPVRRLLQETASLVPDDDGRFVLPADTPVVTGWGRLAPVLRTIADLAPDADVRASLGAYRRLSGVLRLSAGTEVRGRGDWADVLGRFAFPAGVVHEVLPDGYAIVRDVQDPDGPLDTTATIVCTPPAPPRRSVFSSSAA